MIRKRTGITLLLMNTLVTAFNTSQICGLPLSWYSTMAVWWFVLWRIFQAHFLIVVFTPLPVLITSKSSSFLVSFIVFSNPSQTLIDSTFLAVRTCCIWFSSCSQTSLLPCSLVNWNWICFFGWESLSSMIFPLCWGSSSLSSTWSCIFLLCFDLTSIPLGTFKLLVLMPCLRFALYSWT